MLPVGGATGYCCHCNLVWRYFNPRSPWGERPTAIRPFADEMQFQSTLPVGGATQVSIAPTSVIVFQSPLPVGGATMLRLCYTHLEIFQSTLPVGGATDCLRMVAENTAISIHAPRGGSDSKDA